MRQNCTTILFIFILFLNVECYPINATFRGDTVNVMKFNNSIYVNLSYPIECNATHCDPYNVALEAGSYKIELWGASGGENDEAKEKLGAGKGAYVAVAFTLRHKIRLFAYVGSRGTKGLKQAFGGGVAAANEFGFTGGGSSDMRLIEGNISSRIFVAGAGESYFNGKKIKGGDAGGENGLDGCSSSDSSSLKIAKGGGQNFFENQGKGYSEIHRLATSGKLGEGGKAGDGEQHT